VQVIPKVTQMMCPKFETEQEDGRIIAIRMFLTTHSLISQVTEDGNLNFKFDFFIHVKLKLIDLYF
jgi:hypothetical protein